MIIGLPKKKLDFFHQLSCSEVVYFCRKVARSCSGTEQNRAEGCGSIGIGNRQRGTWRDPGQVCPHACFQRRLYGE